jgi:hypothetical protein
MNIRRFPAPWHAEKISGGYVVRDADGQALAYVYSRPDEPEAVRADALTEEEALHLAGNMARLPELLENFPPGLQAARLQRRLPPRDQD